MNSKKYGIIEELTIEFIFSGDARQPKYKNKRASS
jgi:hypothetical protein